MILTDKDLDLIEQQADKLHDINLLFAIQILREVRSLKQSMNESYNTADCGNDTSNCANHSKT